MIDFTSALYLGMHHSSWSLPPWTHLSLGVPAALAEPPGADDVAIALAELQGCEQGLLMPSTLHLFWDLFGMLSKLPITLFIDEETYKIAQWGVERASKGGVVVHRFRHHDPQALLSQMTVHLNRNKRPVVVADGFCPGCGRPAPIDTYLDMVRRFGGLLVLDDTQSLGILGVIPKRHAPYGNGGGGLLRWSGQSGPDILLGSSLAKGFGVPLAVLAGSQHWVSRFRSESDTRVHCSPPSVPVIQAAAHALEVNRMLGDQLRLQLNKRVRQFREGLALIGCCSTGGWFPVQTLNRMRGSSAVRLHQQLYRRGIQAVLSRSHKSTDARLSFLITVRHSARDIDRCLETLDACINGVERLAFVRNSASQS
ncbi:MAG: pyridoxal phosphate-dependent aminotransferase family protein [Methylomicrobium sp.]|nr:pyridoxal phosphate-dependent aminotransferase family protein [Methylomicrobium sp.]